MVGRVYLAGPITGFSFENASDWRNRVSVTLGSFGIDVFSPLRAESRLKGENVMLNHYPDTILSNSKSITNRDRFDVMQCDVLFVNMLGANNVSIGTIIELGWADAFRKPIVLVMQEGNVHDHAMVNEISSFVVRTIEEGIDVVKSLLLK